MAQKFTLSSGMRLLVEPLPHLRSIASGLWVNCGSVYEQTAINGVSHFLEHMLFKGTSQRDALTIAAEMESVGGVLNAFTGKEHTCYYARSLDEHFALQLDLLTDMYQNSLLAEKEFNREKKVIIEEINMYEDSPDEVAMDLFASTIFPDHPYGAPIAGNLTSVGGLSRDDLTAHYQRFYNPQNTVLAIAGNITPEEAIAQAEKCLTAKHCGDPAPNIDSPTASGGEGFIAKDIEQSHVCIGFPGVPLGSDDYYAATIIANALGGGASSRLFQEVREKRGLAYSAYCYLEAYTQAGFIMAYAATTPKNGAELIKIMAEQFAILADKGLTAKEIAQSKDQLKGGLLLNLESTANVMSKLGRTELALGKIYNAEETAAKLMAVTEEDIQRTINKLIVPDKLVLAQVGPQQANINLKELL